MSGPKVSIDRRIRAANYLSAAQIYLQDNFLLDRPLKPEDIKPRLLGHWGTCPGTNLIYANLKSHYENLDHFILGPGHGFPALQANLFLDGELQKVDQNATLDQQGIAYICQNFSKEGGFPSHASPLTPHVIAEGGELGYALSIAYGASLAADPTALFPVLLGDGEFETATTLASLNLPKLIDNKSHARVLPILHLNGYKISGPTISGRKSPRELSELLRGFGYTPFLLDLSGDNYYNSSEPFQEILNKIDTVFAEHRHPFLIARSDKGATGPNRGHLAHQVALKDPRTNPAKLELLESWLKSYHFEQLFDPEKGFIL